jgi:hypothetical protein
MALSPLDSFIALHPLPKYQKIYLKAFRLCLNLHSKKLATEAQDFLQLANQALDKPDSTNQETHAIWCALSKQMNSQNQEADQRVDASFRLVGFILLQLTEDLIETIDWFITYLNRIDVSEDDFYKILVDKSC